MNLSTAKESKCSLSGAKSTHSKSYLRRKLDNQNYAQSLKSIPEHRFEIFIK